jgi:hypothetical protein
VLLHDRLDKQWLGLQFLQLNHSTSFRSLILLLQGLRSNASFWSRLAADAAVLIEELGLEPPTCAHVTARPQLDAAAKLSRCLDPRNRDPVGITTLRAHFRAQAGVT